MPDSVHKNDCTSSKVVLCFLFFLLFVNVVLYLLQKRHRIRSNSRKRAGQSRMYCCLNLEV
jgi:hypothetical protein